jgi:phage tail sheath protein FI
MPAALSYPGVYVEELPSGVRTITGVATSVAAFFGRALRGDIDTAVDITSQGAFDQTFGPLWRDSAMTYAVRDFFANGGQRAVIVRLFHSLAADAALSVATKVAGSADGKTAKAAAADALKAVTDNPASTQAMKDAATAAAGLVAGLADNAAASDVKTALQKVQDLVTTLASAARSISVDTLTFNAASPGSWSGYLRLLVSAASGPGIADVAAALGVAVKDLFNLTVTDTSPGGQTETYLNVTVAKSARRVDKVLANNSSLLVWGGANLDTAPPKLPDFTKTRGDSVGAAYQDMLDARAVNPDPTVDPLKTKLQAYNAAVTAALGSVDDGGGLTVTDFLKPDGRKNKTGLYALEQLYTRDGIFNLMCIPPYTVTGDVDTNLVAVAGAYCEERRAMLLLDAPSTWTSSEKAVNGFSSDPDQVGYRGRNAALFFPRVMMQNPLNDNQLEPFAACGVVAGICARTDTQVGVWKSPAGLDASLGGVSSLSVPLTDGEHGLLNPLGVNCLRTFPVYGRVVWGSRTLRGADAFADDYKYLAVRRTALFIEESLFRGLKWVVFEPNDEPLWAQIRLNVGAFMQDLFRKHAFQGQSAREAYYVSCDSSTTTQNDINLGVVNIKVGFAPLKPAEFVVLQLQQMAGQIQT